MPIVPDREADLDPSFPLPPDVIGLNTQDTSRADVGEAYEQTYEQLEEGQESYEASDVYAPEIDLPVPTYVEVVEQVARFDPTGRHVVDVVLNIEVEGYENFEVRLARA